MIAVVRWYLSAFHAGRRGSVAKKPYNPVIGEQFSCYFDVPGKAELEFKEVGRRLPSFYNRIGQCIFSYSLLI